MAINKKLIHFNTKENFLKEKNAGNILETSIVFIKDTREIWTHDAGYQTMPDNGVDGQLLGVAEDKVGWVNRWRTLKDIVNGYEFVDLGLSVKWATCNIGAEHPYEYGYFFQWAGTIPYNSDRTPVGGGEAIKFGYNSDCPYWVSGTVSTSTKWSKYTTGDYSSTDIADNKLILEPEDDAAHVHIGGNCRMPTNEEFQELIDACNTEWVTDYNSTGINGRLFTLKSDSSKTLFFPASGHLSGTSWSNVGSNGYCLSSSLNSKSYDNKFLYFGSSTCSMGYSAARYYSKPVRAVKPKN